MVDEKANEKRVSSPAYRQGDNLNIKTIILLSAPGEKEERVRRPAAGETGKALQTALGKLHEKDSDTFPSTKLEDYTIANAVEKILYKNKTGRTEGTDKEILDIRNIERIKSILSNSKAVIALGSKAYLAINTANYKGIVFTANHPSLQSLNSKYKSEKTTSKGRNKDRISQWADDLMKSKVYYTSKGKSI